MKGNAAKLNIVDRRSFTVSASAALSLFPFLKTAAADDASPPPQLERTKQFDDAFAALTANGKPVEGKVTLELPEVAENGNFVPLTVTVDSPMTEADYVKTIHILSTSNPVARIASFHLTPANGVAKVQSRIRLAKSQDVLALAHLSNGLVMVGTLMVKVTIGGCSS